MTTGATLSGPSLASWFLERKLGDGNLDTLDQSDWCLMFLCCHAWISLLLLPEPRAKRKTVLKVRCFRDASLSGSKGAFVSWCSTRERFQEGIPLRPLGLSLWKLSRRRVRLSSDIDCHITQFISNGRPVTINGAGLQVLDLKEVEQEISH